MKDGEEKEDDKDPVEEPSPQSRIIDVWEDNFYEELEKIMELIPTYNHVAMDTEFPGCPEVPSAITEDYGYQLVKANVDQCKLIQLGITLFDKEGNPPPGPCCWQFNFKFDKSTEKSAEISIKVLIDAGINFEKHRTNGIDHLDFAYYFLTSGLVLSEDIKWICFHGSQDFGYMYKVLMNSALPDSQDDFFIDLNKYFPSLYDTKYMKHEIEELSGGLQKTGELLNLERIGVQHQAGSDSWLTGLVFFDLRDHFLLANDIEKEYNNIIFGIGVSQEEDAYMDGYKSQTQEIERKQREMGEHMEYNHFDHHSYYETEHHQNDGYHMYVQDSYQENHYPTSQPMMASNPTMSPGNFHPSMSPSMNQNPYAVQHNTVGYHEDDGSK